MSFNHLCDQVLFYLIKEGDLVITQNILSRFSVDSKVLKLCLNRLYTDGFIQNMQGDLPSSHSAFADMGYYITGKGYAFYQDGGYTELTKRILKDRRKIDLEHFKIGWEMIISLVSLCFSFYALYVSSH